MAKTGSCPGVSVSISGSWPEGLKRRKAASAALGFLRKVLRLAQDGLTVKNGLQGAAARLVRGGAQGGGR